MSVRACSGGRKDGMTMVTGKIKTPVKDRNFGVGPDSRDPSGDGVVDLRVLY